VALATGLAALVLPAASQAATVELDGTTLKHRGSSGELNSLNVTMVGSAVEVKDFAGLTSRTNLCVNVTSATVRCAIGVVTRIDADLGDRNDSTSIRTPLPVVVKGGTGNDSFVGGNGPTATNIAYHGGIGADVMSYAHADRGVQVNTTNFFTSDGRRGLDRDNVMDDVEVIRGSDFDDDLADFGQGGPKTLDGNGGNDLLRAGLEQHTTTFDMNAAVDGADRVIVPTNSVFAFLDYSKRTQPIKVTVDQNGNDDGAFGEGDEIMGVSRILGGQAGDTLRANPTSTAGVFYEGAAGDDRLEGAAGADLLRGGDGSDTLIGNNGDDFLDARDAFADIVGCGSGTDTAVLDSRDGFAGCETVRR
jgi:hypothetical protein